MNQKDLISAINLIRDKAEKGKLIVFVGAGVSCNVEGMPSWHELVKIMANAVGYSKCDQCKNRTSNCKKTCLLKDSFSTDEFLKIPQYLYNSNKKKYYEKFKELFKEVKTDAALSRAIFELNPAHIITTNYDHLLESSKCELRQQYQVIIEDKDLLNTYASKYIIKMHGDLDNMKSIVLKEQDYLDFSQNKILIELFVKALLTDHLVLFLGYSLSDYNIKLILSWLNFMRQQNGALEGKTVGYIALDSVKLSKTQKRYLEKNSINVLNLYEMPLIEDIPESLKLDEGKRLYSFLKVIQYPRQMKIFGKLEFLHDIVAKIGDKPFISYKDLLRMLQINYTQRMDNTLSVLTEDDFAYIKEICDAESVEPNIIKQHLINNGIYFISYWNHFRPNEPTEYYTLANHEESNIFRDKWFEYYLGNNYTVIHNQMNAEDKNIKYHFYSQFFNLYNQTVIDDYNGIDFNALSECDKLGFLYNKAMLDWWSSFQYSLKTLKNYYDAIPSQEQKNLLSIYNEACNGFQDRKSIMTDKLNQLIDLYSAKSFSLSGSTFDPFFEIKNLAIELYKFHFYNKLFCEKRDTFKKVLKLYIESIICTNGEYGESRTNPFGIRMNQTRYGLDILDWDIITKYISTKDLLSLLKKYRVRKIAVAVDKSHIIAGFKNLISAVDLASLSPYSSFWAAITNYFTLLSYIEFVKEEKMQIADAIEILLSNHKFLKYFFSIQYPDFQYCIGSFANICKKVIEKNHLDIIQRILSIPTFFDYYVNANHQSIRSLFEALMAYYSEEGIQVSLFDIINSEHNIKYKNRIIWLFKNLITKQEYINKLKEVLEENWRILESSKFIEFVFSDWIILNDNKANFIISEVIKLDKERSSSNCRQIPDPFDAKLDVLCLLILCNKILDFDSMRQIANKTPQLEFLLNPETFDYSQVDFSNYMWENIARNGKYLNYFIKYREKIIPRIREHIHTGNANEFERQMLYGVLMNRDELF